VDAPDVIVIAGRQSFIGFGKSGFNALHPASAKIMYPSKALTKTMWSRFSEKDRVAHESMIAPAGRLASPVARYAGLRTDRAVSRRRQKGTRTGGSTKKAVPGPLTLVDHGPTVYWT